MKFAAVLALAVTSSAFVLPDEQLFSSLETQPRHDSSSHVIKDFEGLYEDAKNSFETAFGRVSEKVKSRYELFAEEAKSSFDDAFAYIEDTTEEVGDQLSESYFGAKAYLDSAKETWDEEADYSTLGHPHHGGHHHHKPNMTVYQLIASSKYTTKLAKLVNKYDDLVEALNGTSANFTVFAPTNRAFEKIPEHAPEPSEEFLKTVLLYHVSPDFYPAGRVLVTRTIPTLLNSSALGKKSFPQRLSTNIGLRGLTVNYYSRIVAVDIFGTNGVIHGVDSFLIPPPRVLKIIDLLPTEFSTLELGLGKTGLLEKLNTTDHHGGTFFAPSNFAFQKLGPRINAFLFSSYGLKYLKALLLYHVVPEKTLYSDAFYDGTADSSLSETGIPKGYYHIDLPTMLEDRALGIDIARYGRLIEIKINGFARVSTPDFVAYDGVLHILNDVLIPPKRLPGGTMEQWNGMSEMTEEDLMERLGPFVESTWFTEEL